jgi:hypothetical protein
MNAAGLPDPLPLAASSETLTTLTDRVEARLQDTGNARWAAADIQESIEQALEQWSRHDPYLTVGTVTLAADGREISLSTLTGLLRVEQVWCPYTAADPDYPPNWVQFRVWPGPILFIDEPTEPEKDDVARIWYTKMHTISGLNSASATTLPAEDVGYFINGAAGFAAQMRAVELAETLNADRDVVKRLNDWAEENLKNFRYGMSLRQPWAERQWYAHDQNDLDEAIRWALGRYNEVNPQVTIDTVTLSDDGREVDISDITDYLEIIRVWWPYTSTSPENPPNWRDFEVWPGDVLYIKADSEPAEDDVVRIWYKKLRTISGLDSATSTTLPAQHESILLAGAAGFAAQERVQDESSRWVPRKLREWADARLREFERGLNKVARQLSSKHSGFAPVTPLDRWDKQDDDW